MTGIRGDGSRRALLPIAIMMMLLVGCAPTVTRPGTAGPQGASPPPTAACPQVEGAELPPECAPYDPDHAMAQNDRHRERMPLDEEPLAEAEDAITSIRPALEALVAGGDVTADAVTGVFQDAGLAGIDVRSGTVSVLFGVDGPAGGCIFGEVSTTAVAIEAGGYILDGGCLPMN